MANTWMDGPVVRHAMSGVLVLLTILAIARVVMDFEGKVMSLALDAIQFVLIIPIYIWAQRHRKAKP